MQMKHFWINIDRNAERQQFMSEQFAKMGIENYRISAYTPADFDDILVQSRPLTCKYPGCVTCEFEFACICSHLKAIEEGVKTGDPYFAIVEDDIYLPFKIDYDALVYDMPPDAEILQLLILYGNSVKMLYNFHQHTGQRYIKWQYLLPSTGLYIISREGGQRLLNLFKDPLTQKYDFSESPYQIVADVLLYMTAVTYAATHPYAFPNIDMGSEIHSDHLIAQGKAIRDIKEVMYLHYSAPFPFVKEAVSREELENTSAK
jgi:GR25 family glycosyltransferase involved in LPS biosynthesis